MKRLIKSVVPITLIVVGLLVMASSSLAGGGLSAVIGLPIFTAGFVWLVLPEYLERRRAS